MMPTEGLLSLQEEGHLGLFLEGPEEESRVSLLESLGVSRVSLMNFLRLLAKLGEAERVIRCVLEKLLGFPRMFGRVSFSLNFTHCKNAV